MPVPRRLLFALCAALTIAFACLPAMAQDQGAPLLQLASGFKEKLLPSPPLAGEREAPKGRDPMRTLVGLHFVGAEMEAQFHVDQIGVQLDRRAPARDFCVRIISDDARYNAENPYRKADDPAPSSLIETRSGIAPRLATDFNVKDMIIRVLAGSHCGEAEKGKLVAARPPPLDKPRDRLKAFLNASGAAQAWLSSKAHDFPPVNCRRARTDIKMYNYICELPLAPLGGQKPDTLKILTLENGVSLVEPYPLLWTDN